MSLSTQVRTRPEVVVITDKHGSNGPLALDLGDPNEQAAELMGRLSGNSSPFSEGSEEGTGQPWSPKVGLPNKLLSTFLVPDLSIHATREEYEQAAMKVYEPCKEEVKKATEYFDTMVASSNMPPTEKTNIKDINSSTCHAFSMTYTSLMLLTTVCWSIKSGQMGHELGLVFLTKAASDLIGHQQNIFNWVTILLRLSNEHMQEHCRRIGAPEMKPFVVTANPATGPVEMNGDAEAAVRGHVLRPNTAVATIEVLRQAQVREAQINRQEAAAGGTPNWALYLALGAAAAALAACAVVAAPVVAVGAALAAETVVATGAAAGAAMGAAASAAGATASAGLAQASAAAGAMAAPYVAAANAAVAPYVAAAGVAIVEYTAGTAGYVAAAAGGGAAAVAVREATRDDD